MNEKEMLIKGRELERKCKQLARKTKTMTNTEKRRKYNELAREFIRLSCDCEKVSRIYSDALFKAAVKLKYAAVTPPRVIRRGRDIRRKVVKFK